MDSETRRVGRVVLLTVLGTALFVATATLFANLLRPVVPSKAMKDHAVVELPFDAEAEAAAGDRGPTQSDPITERMAAPEPLPDGPLIAIVMTELGADPEATLRIIDDLPPEISLSFTPYARESRSLAASARARGHEALVSLPMQPQSWPRVSPGPHTLRTDVGEAENQASLEWALSRFDDLDGATGMMGSAFTRSEDALAPVMKALHMQGLSFIDQRASGSSVAEQVARASGVPSRTNDRFIDEPADRGTIDRRLRELVRIAKRRGWAIGYARPLPVTTAALAEFAATADAEGVTLVGVSRLVRQLPEAG